MNNINKTKQAIIKAKLYDKYHRALKKIKSLKKNILIYISLPHVWILVIIFIISIITGSLSVACMNSKPFLSSLFANIFAGLITGIIIGLVSTIKSISLYKTKCLIEWLDSLHEIILRYFIAYRKIVDERRGINKNCKCFQPNLKSDCDAFHPYHYNSFEDKVSCVLSIYSEVDDKISSGMFDQTLSFDSCKYAKKKLNYDVIKYIEIHEKQRNRISNISESEMIPQRLEAEFKEMNCHIKELNERILDNINHLKERKNIISSAVM